MKKNKDILVEIMDTSVSPGQDFFKYATGTWMKKNPIPESESIWYIGKLVQEEIYNRLKKISEEAAGSKEVRSGSNMQKIGDFYSSGMDTAMIEKKGIEPVSTELDRIASIRDMKGLLEEAAVQKIYGIGSFFGIYVGQDDKNSEKMALILSQGGLGLPGMEYYMNNDSRTLRIRREYVKHVSRMMQLLGDDSVTAKKQSETIMKIETSLASRSRRLEDLRDPYKNYNKMSMSSMNKITPSIDWKEFLLKMGVQKPDTVIVGQPEFLKELGQALGAFSIDDWKCYMKWHLVNIYAEGIGSAFEDEDFRFKGTVLSGTKIKRDRWKRVLDAEENALGDALGQLYVSKYFSETTKKRYEIMVDKVIDAFRERMRNLEWMSPATRDKAIAKLNKVVRKVGYPAKWKDYSALEITRDSYAANLMRANKWAFNYQLNKLGKPVDRTEWGMTPQTYNAYYNPSNNEIVLPAAQFVIPDLPDSLADDALMYGYVGGSTIGHEIVHGFDDQGRQYNDKGNLANWWTKADEKKFNERARVMVEQFNSYKVLDSLHVNGEATLGENIADLAGVLIAYDAFQNTGQAKSGQMISGFTPDQRYFLGYALSWLGHQRDERLARQIMTDVHSPAFLRVNGPVSNIPAFFKAFNVKPGDPMYRSGNQQVKIW